MGSVTPLEVACGTPVCDTPLSVVLQRLFKNGDVTDT